MVYVFLADGFEEIEALTVVDLGRRAGLDVQTVSITRDKTVTGARGIPVVTDTVIKKVDWEGADMLVLPGGMPGTRNLEACEELMAHVDDMAGSGRNVSAICAAPTILGHRGILNGRRACCYPGLEGQLTGAMVCADTVSVDGNIVTSRGVGTAIDFALAIITKLVSKEKADEIAKSVVYHL
ncbi:MAG: DJ-1/PfpI family protein [Lachnospiraceae bacterium]|nr:DJ-1/PfpI family protein [Lachnospiraceae bacterium]